MIIWACVELTYLPGTLLYMVHQLRVRSVLLPKDYAVTSALTSTMPRGLRLASLPVDAFWLWNSGYAGTLKRCSTQNRIVALITMQGFVVPAREASLSIFRGDNDIPNLRVDFPKISEAHALSGLRLFVFRTTGSRATDAIGAPFGFKICKPTSAICNRAELTRISHEKHQAAGELAEILFLYQAAAMGMIVTQPYGDNAQIRLCRG